MEIVASNAISVDFSKLRRHPITPRISCEFVCKGDPTFTVYLEQLHGVAGKVEAENAKKMKERILAARLVSVPAFPLLALFNVGPHERENYSAAYATFIRGAFIFALVLIARPLYLRDYECLSHSFRGSLFVRINRKRIAHYIIVKFTAHVP